MFTIKQAKEKNPCTNAHFSYHSYIYEILLLPCWWFSRFDILNFNEFSGGSVSKSSGSANQNITDPNPCYEIFT